jgi:hypothetical protein
MTNDEVQMSIEAQMTNDELRRIQNSSHVRQNVGKPTKLPHSGERGYDGFGY